MCAKTVPPRNHQPIRRRTVFNASLAAACALATVASASAPSGLHGVIRKGPVTPVCRVGQPCDAPAQVTLVFSRPGGAPVTARSDRQGRYRVLLNPGFYAVTTRERIGIGRNIRPRNVHVRAGHVDLLNFSIDTGIR